MAEAAFAEAIFIGLQFTVGLPHAQAGVWQAAAARIGDEFRRASRN